MKLLPKESLIKTSEVDHADWNYFPILGSIQRMRFKLAESLLPSDRVQRLLEIGYGSGILMPELSQRCNELYGIDWHKMNNSVSEMLSKVGISAKLYSGSAEEMPFADMFFDCVVSVSALEFMENIDDACREIKRVLKPGCPIIVVTPGFSKVVDFGLWIMTGSRARLVYGNRREMVIPTLMKYFTVEKKIPFPSIGSSLLRLYCALKLSN